MKIKLITVLVLTALNLMVGCVTKQVVTTDATGHSITNFVKAPDVGQISDAAGRAANLGSRLWLAKHPEDRNSFLTANEALKDLIFAKNYDPAAFSAALQGLPIKEFKGDTGSIVVETVITIYDTAISFAGPVTRQELVAAVLFKVQAGIQRTLDATAPRSEYLDRVRQAWRADAVPTYQIQ